MYTLQYTFQELMDNRLLKRSLGNLFPSEWLEALPKSQYSKTLAQLMEEEKMQWGAPFLSKEIIACANILTETANEKRFLFQPMWQDSYEQNEFSIPDSDLNNEEGVWLFTGNPAVDNQAFAHTDIPGSVPPYAAITPDQTAPDSFENADKPAHTSGTSLLPAVIICPGGGYSMLSTYSEGLQLAARFERDGGYKAFILNSRLAPNTWPLPQMDLARAIMYVRKHADEYHINPDQILIIGSSAGGHLCASEALYHEELKKDILKKYPEYLSDYQPTSARPDGVGLLYPVISFTSEYHEGSFLNNTGGDLQLKDKLSVELHMKKDYPPTYAFANRDDGCVPFSNTTRLDQALKEADIPHLCEIFPTGDHGIGLGYQTSAKYWSEHMLSFFAEQFQVNL